METLTPELQFQRLFEFLATPVGLFIAVVLFAVFPALAVSKRGRWILISLLLFFSPLMVPGTAFAGYVPAITPFQQFRTYGRPMCGIILVLLLIPTIHSQRGWRQRIIIFPTVAFFLFEILFSARNIAGGAAFRGAIAFGVFFLIFAVMAIGIPRWLQDLSDVRALVRAVGLSGIMMVICTMIQLAANRSAATAANRLIGLTANAQQMALVTSVTLIPVAFLMLWKDETKRWRIAWALTAASLLILLAWTGSRTGTLVAATGLLILFRRHIGRFFSFGVLSAILILFGLALFGIDISEPTSRLFRTDDTRTGVWRRMFEDFMANPMMGIPAEEASGSENSFLLVAARTGIVGLLPLLVVLGGCAVAAFSLHRSRRVLREQSLLVDLTLGGLASLFLGAMFEGYLMGTLTHQVFMIYLYLALLGYLLDAAEVQPAFAAADPSGGSLPFDGQAAYIPS